MENVTHASLQKKSYDKMKNIFISYGRDEFAGFVKKIAEKLKDRGHSVWFDSEKLTPGKDWEEQIELGIKFLAEDKAKGIFLLIMTPHSVRRPDGYCLNELARALKKKISVIPVMLIESVPPLSICRIQYLDLTTSTQGLGIDTIFENIFSKICNSIENNVLDQEAVISSLYYELNPLDFNAEISFHQPNFTGRDWIFKFINSWVSDEEKNTRFLVILGEPGIGKSAISSQLLANSPDIKAFHFCRRGHSEKSSFKRAISTFSYQLSTQIPSYKDKIIKININQELLRLNETALFDLLLVQPLNSIYHEFNENIVFLIDGLDESYIDGGNNFSRLVYSEFSRLNKNVTVIITSRTSDECINYFFDYDKIEIESSSNENISDLNNYISKTLSKNHNICDVKIKNIKNMILENSYGSFLYAKHICSKVNMHKNLDDFKICTYEKGIYSIYFDYFYNKFYDDTFYRNNISPALEVLIASFEPLSKNELKKILGWDNYKINDFISNMASFIKIVEGNKIIVFHATFFDWLEDRDNNKKFWVDEEMGKEKIFSALWSIFENSDYSFLYEGVLDRYLMKHLPKLMDYNKKNILFSDVLEKYSFQMKNYPVVDFAVYKNENFNFMIEMFTYFIKNDKVFYIDFEIANKEKKWLSSHLRGITFLFNKIKGNDKLNKEEDFHFSSEYYYNKYYYFLDISIPKFYISDVDAEIITTGLLTGLDGAVYDGRISTIPFLARDYINFIFKMNINNKVHIKKCLNDLSKRYKNENWGFEFINEFLIDYANNYDNGFEKKIIDECFDFLKPHN